MRIIQVDFNSRDEADRVWLTLPCSQADIAKLPAPLTEGDSVTLTDGEGYVQAVATRDGGHWFAVADWDTWREDLMADVLVRVGECRPVRSRAA